MDVQRVLEFSEEVVAIFGRSQALGGLLTVADGVNRCEDTAEAPL